MKKTSSVLIATLIATAALVACGKKEDTAPAVVTPPPAPVTEPAPAPAAPAADPSAAAPAPSTDAAAMPAPGASSAMDSTDTTKKSDTTKP